jgi:hypothetical protein
VLAAPKTSHARHRDSFTATGANPDDRHFFLATSPRPGSSNGGQTELFGCETVPEETKFAPRNGPGESDHPEGGEGVTGGWGADEPRPHASHESIGGKVAETDSRTRAPRDTSRLRAYIADGTAEHG